VPKREFSGWSMMLEIGNYSWTAWKTWGWQIFLYQWALTFCPPSSITIFNCPLHWINTAYIIWLTWTSFRGIVWGPLLRTPIIWLPMNWGFQGNRLKFSNL
jgi:hypothetical protein